MSIKKQTKCCWIECDNLSQSHFVGFLIDIHQNATFLDNTFSFGGCTSTIMVVKLSRLFYGLEWWPGWGSNSLSLSDIFSLILSDFLFTVSQQIGHLTLFQPSYSANMCLFISVSSECSSKNGKNLGIHGYDRTGEMLTTIIIMNILVPSSCHYC